MRRTRNPWLAGFLAILTAMLTTVGCYHTPIDTSEYAQGPAPLRMPSPANDPEACNCYEDSLTGGQLFKMYCNYCHNAPSLAERPFSNFQNVASHMRVRANLTGKEYAKLMEFFRRWNDIPPPIPPTEPSPKRFIFSHAIQELRPKPSADGSTPKAQAEAPQATGDNPTSQ